MAAYRKGRFSWRAFVSLYVTWSSIILLVSGIILYIAPAGRIAKWTHIPILGLEKSEWQAIHTIFSFILIIFAGLHLYYNWRPFTSYLRDRFKKTFALRKELTTSLLLTIVFFVLTLWNVPPFSTIMDLGEYFTESWETNVSEPPIPHAEELTIEELAKTIKQPADVLLKNLQENGIQAQKDMVVKDVAKKYDLSPSELYEKMKISEPSKTSQTKSYAGRGFGRKSVEEICKELNIPLSIALDRLKAEGIETDGTILLRDLADRYNKTPMEIVEIIEKKEQQ